MKKKILFCNVAWMKNYTGIREDDKPINGGDYIEQEGTGGEVYNFVDDNGICHGFVMVGGNMALENHFKDVKAKDEYVDNVLVIWVATNRLNQTRIVGWYKNARVYREVKELIFFTEQSANQYYNIEAKAIDTYLVPEEDRVFPINRAADAGLGTGFGQSNIWYAESGYAKSILIPEVIKYIDSHANNYSNFVYDSWDINELFKDIDYLDNFDKLYNTGLKYFEDRYYFDAVVYFKAAQLIHEPISLLNKLAKSLFNIFQYSEAIEIFKRIIDSEGETMELLYYMMNSYDYIQNREKTIEYANKLIDFPSYSDIDINDKIFAHFVIFNIYIYEYKFKLAEELISDLQRNSESSSAYPKEDINAIVNDLENHLKIAKKNLVR